MWPYSISTRPYLDVECICNFGGWGHDISKYTFNRHRHLCQIADKKDAAAYTEVLGIATDLAVVSPGAEPRENFSQWRPFHITE